MSYERIFGGKDGSGLSSRRSFEQICFLNDDLMVVRMVVTSPDLDDVRGWWGWCWCSEQISDGVSEKRRSSTLSVPYMREEGCGGEDDGGGRGRWWWNKGWWKNTEGRRSQWREEEDWVLCLYKNTPAFKSEMSKLSMVSVLCLNFCVQLSLLININIVYNWAWTWGQHQTWYERTNNRKERKII